jgi:hypothetical protein
MNKKFVYMLIVFALMIATSVSARVNPCNNPSLSCVDAVKNNCLTGSISGGNAQVTNNAAASYNVGLAIYKVFDKDDHTQLEHQVLFDSDTGSVNKNSKLNLNVDLPGCQYQIDLFCGAVIEKFDQAKGIIYGERKLDYYHKTTGSFCTQCSNGYGTACNGPTNNCGVSTSGTQLCDGTCSVKVAPANPADYGKDCESPANACGQTAKGTILCDGSCSAMPPSSTGCGGGGEPGVPVFPGITIGFAVIGAGLGIAMLRKH